MEEYYHNLYLSLRAENVSVRWSKSDDEQASEKPDVSRRVQKG